MANHQKIFIIQHYVKNDNLLLAIEGVTKFCDEFLIFIGGYTGVEIIRFINRS